MTKISDKYKIALLEDEAIIADNLIRNLEKLGFKVYEPCANFQEGVDLLEKETPDIFIVDVNLNDSKSGIEFAEYLNEKHKVPFLYLTSQLDKQTLDAAKETKPLGYLTKPINIENLYATLEIILHNTKKVERDFISVKYGIIDRKVNYEQICYIKSDHVYINFVTPKQTYTQRGTLKEILRQLQDDRFIQVHRSYVVNINKLSHHTSEHVFFGTMIIPIGRKYLIDFKESIAALG